MDYAGEMPASRPATELHTDYGFSSQFGLYWNLGAGAFVGLVTRQGFRAVRRAPMTSHMQTMRTDT
ncbi:hypothetical protein AAW01_10825 [Aurantiacibacter gangjinensis]|uniref:Uncharacterized protein n=1 Tax=Aurantiacibacter gangjinensis TaxID=502682 RepID=A0A0G9MML3_9SPHN|nr:hypothetical protein AAW01_10825 [Aurantiacibacter gangjinensis]